MKSAMRKLISLCVLAMVAISPLAMAQETGTAPAITIEAAITAEKPKNNVTGINNSSGETILKKVEKSFISLISINF